MTDDTAIDVIEREMRVRHGRVPDTIDGRVVGNGRYILAGEEFQLRVPGLACHYRKGDGVTVQLDDPNDTGMLELYLAGSVHSAVAAINGLTALHASAVACNGCVVAFAGDPGAGKSTTVAALRQRGFAIVADDTLVLDMSGDRPMCLPGHKRLKLWPDSLAMTGLSGLQLVSESYPKFFATEEGSEIASPMPLCAIVSLAKGPELSFEPVRGAGRVAVLDDDHYTAEHRAIACGLDQAGRLGAIADLANRTSVYLFIRPMDPDHFAPTIDFLAEQVSQITAERQ